MESDILNEFRCNTKNVFKFILIPMTTFTNKLSIYRVNIYDSFSKDLSYTPNAVIVLPVCI